MKNSITALLVFFPACAFSQNVGVGTVVPSEKLEVKNPLRSTAKISSSSFSDTTEILLSNRNNANAGTDFSIKNIREEGLFISSLSDLPANTSSNSLVIKPAGNVGIGIVPAAANRLHILGTSNFNGLVKLEGLNLFEFGAGVAGKELNAGKVGYNAFGQNALTFVGAGTNTTNRAIYFFAEGGTTMTGSLAIAGPLRIHGNSGTSGQVLTSNGTTAPAWADAAFSNNIRFGVRFSLNSNGLAAMPIVETEYNLSTPDITIGTSSITINRSGLYRLNGVVTGTISYTGTTDPAFVPQTQTQFQFGGTSSSVLNLSASDNFTKEAFVSSPRYNFRSPFSFDVYLPAGTTITIFNDLFFMSPPAVTSSNTSVMLHGYLISE